MEAVKCVSSGLASVHVACRSYVDAPHPPAPCRTIVNADIAGVTFRTLKTAALVRCCPLESITSSVTLALVLPSTIPLPLRSSHDRLSVETAWLTGIPPAVVIGLLLIDQKY